MRKKDMRITIEELIDNLINHAIDWSDNDFSVEKQALLDAFPHWIPITVRLPKDREKVMLLDHGSIQLGCYSDKLDQWETVEPSAPDYWSNVTHWQPLPEPPAQEEQRIMEAIVIIQDIMDGVKQEFLWEQV